MENVFALIAVLAFSGAVAGCMAGLLGIGGGIVLVPVLYALYTHIDLSSVHIMQVTVATSLAIMVPTAFFSSWEHKKADAIDVDLIKSWGVGIFLGAVSGAALGSNLSSSFLTLFFAVMAGLMGIKLLLPLDDKILAQTYPKGFLGSALGWAVGMVSGLMGIGGATFCVPLLTFLNVPIHLAIGTASAVGLVIAVPGAIGYMGGGLLHGVLSHSLLGFVHWPAVVIIAPVAAICAPWGARLAHRLDRRTLSVVFGVFLLVAALRMTYPLIVA